MMIPMMYVNVYYVDRNYGGPEEGGWWFERGDPVEDNDPWLAPMRTSQQTVNVEATRAAAQERCDWANKDRRSDISSVLSEGRFEVRVERHPSRGWPEFMPHYC